MASSATAKRRRQRERFWLKDPHCHWCGRLTVLVFRRGGPQASDEATIDHLYSRFNPKRYMPVPQGEIRRVLACYDCNQQRQVEEHRLIGNEALRERSVKGHKEKFNVKNLTINVFN